MGAMADHFRRWRASALLAGVIGCAGRPAYHTAPIPAFMKEDVGLSVQPPESPVYQAGYLEEPIGRPEVVNLSQAIEEAVAHNLRVHLGMEKVQAARANLTTASVIPNPSLQLDAQFVPLPGAQPFDQNPGSGPPQYDALVSFPIDWYLFGKRVAAMEAARLGVDVAAANHADLVRKRVEETLDAYYAVLEAKAQLKLAEENRTDLEKAEKIAEEQAKLGGAKAIEVDRVKLARLDAERDAKQRRTAVSIAKSKLRPLLGRLSNESRFEVVGELAAAATVPIPTAEEAIARAEQQRPDLLADQRGIRQAEAALRAEEKKAKPTVAFSTGMTYQQTKFITGLPSQRFLDFYLTTSLPFTDRNQGGVARAQSELREWHLKYQVDLAEVRAEVEQAVRNYQTAHAAVTVDDPAGLKLARAVLDKTEAAFKQGGLTLIDLLDARREYRERIKTSITSQADYWRALNHLNAAMGARLDEDVATNPALHNRQTLPGSP